MKLGRNDPCTCGSGKKYKTCCQRQIESNAPNNPAKANAPTSVEQNQLIALFNTGLYVEMENQARLLIERYPDSGFSWKVLGASLQMQNKDALSILQKAAELLPRDAEAHNNLGNALRGLGQFDDAAACFSRALEIKPDLTEAHNGLGNALRDIGQFDNAVASFHQALKIKPNFAEAHNNLGTALRNLGRFNEAAASYRQALKIKPDFAEAHYNLGTVLGDLGLFNDAVASHRRAIEIRPDYVEAHNNLGCALYNLGQLADAMMSHRRALEIKPDYVEAYINLGNTLKEFGELDGAVACFRRVVEIKPDYAEAHFNLGNALRDLGQFDDAVASYRQALEIKPNYAEAYNNLGNVLKDLGQLEDAVASYRWALEIRPDFAEAHSNLLLSYNLLLKCPPAEMLDEACHYGDLVAKQAHPYKSWLNVPDHSKRLRIGLVSGDFINHPVGYFLESVLKSVTSQVTCHIELYAYSCSSRTDTLTERIKACCQGWHSAVGQPDEALARKIHDDAIDILIDLSGHTDRNRLPMFAWKPAPIQVSWLGYFATTGVAAVDYLIADPWVLPETEEAYFTEKIWRLPETRLCFTPPDIDLEVSPLPALTNGYVTFGCFNNLSKMNDEVVAIWSHVLASMPSSRLFLKAKQLKNNSLRQNTIERFAAHGIDADRLILEGPEPRAKYLTAYHRVDIALDPFPHPGGTTSAEGLWMGIPVLTLAGERFLSRQGAGILMNVGLSEWIAVDTSSYVAQALSHASDLQRLAMLRKELRQQILASPICDAQRFAVHFEAAMCNMWRIWCEQQQGSK